MRKQKYILTPVIFTFSARYLALKAPIDTNFSNFKQFASRTIKKKHSVIIMDLIFIISRNIKFGTKIAYEYLYVRLVLEKLNLIQQWCNNSTR
jgi:hypothetical protein